MHNVLCTIRILRCAQCFVHTPYIEVCSAPCLANVSFGHRDQFSGQRASQCPETCAANLLKEFLTVFCFCCSLFSKQSCPSAIGDSQNQISAESNIGAESAQSYPFVLSSQQCKIEHNIACAEYHGANCSDWRDWQDSVNRKVHNVVLSGLQRIAGWIVDQCWEEQKNQGNA